MAGGGRHIPDWRDAAAYEPLLDADRSLIAWEWLRRNPDYQAAADLALHGDRGHEPTRSFHAPGRWGLIRFEAPGATVPEARPMWCAHAYPYVLEVAAGPPGGGEAFELERLEADFTLVRASDGREHLLVSDGFRLIRIDVAAGTLSRGPARLSYQLAGLGEAEQPLLTLRRLLALWRTGHFSRLLHPREARARRWVQMLRAHDALCVGACQRDIAAGVLRAKVADRRWRIHSPSIRAQAQRLVRTARRMASGGYCDLLG